MSRTTSGRTVRRRSVAAVLGALLGAACGTLGHDPQPGAPGDGVSGFRFESLVELCIGTAPVSGSPTPYGQLAVCVAEDTEAKVCDSTSDCDHFTEECRCGRCVVRACERNAGQCGEGSICSGGRCTSGCSVDSECGEGQKCAGGGCATPCDSAAPCAYGERCDVTGACRAASCSGGAGCGRGQECEVFQETATIREPATLPETDLRYVEMTEPGKAPAIFRAREMSAKTWVATSQQPVLELAEGASAPFVRNEEGGVALYVGSSDGASIQRAWSADGTAFGEAVVVLSAETEGWEKGWIGSPSVIDFEGKRLLFYEAGPGAGIGIAELAGRAGGVAERLHERAAIDPTRVEDPLFWRSIQSVSTPYAVVVNDAVRIYFTALGAEGNAAVDGDALLPADINYSIGMITTRDFVNYESFPTGPIYARRTSLRAYLGEREPHLLFSDDGVRLYFRATTAGGTDAGLAVAIAE